MAVIEIETEVVQVKVAVKSSGAVMVLRVERAFG